MGVPEAVGASLNIFKIKKDIHAFVDGLLRQGKMLEIAIATPIRDALR